MKFSLRMVFVLVTAISVALCWFCTRESVIATGPVFLIFRACDGEAELELTKAFRESFYERLTEEFQLRNPEVMRRLPNKGEFVRHSIKLEDLSNKKNGVFAVRATGNLLRADREALEILLELSATALSDNTREYWVEILRQR